MKTETRSYRTMHLLLYNPSEIIKACTVKTKACCVVYTTRFSFYGVIFVEPTVATDFSCWIRWKSVPPPPPSFPMPMALKLAMLAGTAQWTMECE